MDNLLENTYENEPSKGTAELSVSRVSQRIPASSVKRQAARSAEVGFDRLKVDY